MNYKFFCDFDGTVTKEDVIDRILEEFADPIWQEIEQSWVEGEIGSRDCLALQTRLINAKERDLVDFIGGIEIDQTFIDFVRYCRDKAFEIVILSDGIDLFINAILNRYGLKDVKVYANGLVSNSQGYEMYFPYFRKDCLSGSGICKCKAMEGLSNPSSTRILIGDGRSDFCIARKVDMTFAKSALLDFCRAEKISHRVFKEFGDIIRWLENQTGQEPFVSEKAFINLGLGDIYNG